MKIQFHDPFNSYIISHHRTIRAAVIEADQIHGLSSSGRQAGIWTAQSRRDIPLANETGRTQADKVAKRKYDQRTAH
jgi:hypothetical protein